MAKLIRASFAWVGIILLWCGRELSWEVGRWGKVGGSMINHVSYTYICVGARWRRGRWLLGSDISNRTEGGSPCANVVGKPGLCFSSSDVIILISLG